MIVDELFVKKGKESLPIDSLNDQIIDEIVLDGQSFHFAKPKGVTGEGEVIADNAVDEPIIALQIDGNTTQKTYEGNNLFNQRVLLYNKNFTEAEYNGEKCIKVIPETYQNYFTLPKPIPQGEEISFGFDVAHPETNGNFYVYVKYESGTSTAFIWYNIAPPTSDFVHTFGRITAAENVTEIMFAFFDRFNYRPYYFKNFMLNIGNEKSYEPYVGGTYSPSPDYPQTIENANQKPLLPTEYQEVEYAESTGTQYIDTGVIPTIDTTVEIVLLNKANDKFPYGSRTSTSSTDKHCINFNPNTSKIYPLFGNSSATASSFVTTTTSIYRAKNGKDGFYVDGILVRDYGDVTFGTSTLSMYLFALNTPAEAYTKRAFVGNIYSCKIFEGNTLVRNFVPCYRKADNVIGMYDLVNDVFYTNQGTGEFLKGADVITEGMSVVLHGSNFFNAQALNSGTSIVANEDGSEIVVNTQTSTVVPSFKTLAELCPYLQIGDKVTLQFDTNSVEKGILLSEDGDWYIGNSKTVTEQTLNSQVMFLCFGPEMPIYYHNMRITYENESGTFNPFVEPMEIPIPQSVEVNGTDVELKLGKQGNKADKLIVDRVSNKVTYEQWVKTEPLLTATNLWNISSTANQVKTIRPAISMIYYSNVDYSQHYIMNKFIETFDTLLDEQNFTQGTGSLNDWVAIRVDRNLLETQNVSGWVKWLQSQRDAGDPVLINFALTEPITHDITNTDLGQQLLSLATHKGVNHLKITGNIEPSKTDLTYWRQIIPNE